MAHDEIETASSALRDDLQRALGAAYSLDRELGGGGMSRVFVARDEALGREVVVKVLAPELAEGVSAERFTREIKLVAALQEPHIVPVHAAGVTRGGLPWYTMPFVRGDSLRARIARGAIPAGDAVSILRDVAKALAYAHEHRVVHRDIKPENILLSSGTAVVTDFGIAKALHISRRRAQDGSDDATLTMIGMSLGTPAYMAPEQAAGDPATDHRADLYAWGVVAYEVLAGAPPFTGSAHELVTAHLTKVPSPLAERAPSVPTQFAALVMACLEKDPAQRPPSAHDLLAALDTIPMGALSEDVRVRARRRRRWPLLGVAVLTLLVAGGLAVWRGRAARGSAAEAKPKMLAVLPFKNLGQPEDAYFADGVTEEITSRLAAVSGLGVISRTSTDQYKGTTKPLKQIADELGVEYVLEGSVRWEKSRDGAGRVRVTPQLIRVRDDSHVWADQLDADAVKIFEIQTAIARQVASALDVALNGRENAAVARPQPTKNFTAYNLVLRAIALRARQDPVSIRAAMVLTEQALREDPTFALAHLQQYHEYSALGFYQLDTAISSRAKAALARAVALAPEEPEVRRAVATNLGKQGDPHGALEQLERLVRDTPSNAAVHSTMGNHCWALGRYAEAQTHFDKALLLDPRNQDAAMMAAIVASWLRDFAAARRYYERAIAVEPNADAFNIAATLAALAGDRAETGRLVREGMIHAGAGPLAFQLSTQRPIVVAALLDSATWSALAAVPLSAFSGESAQFYVFRAALHRARRASALERAYADSARRALEAGMRVVPSDSLQLWFPLSRLAIVRAQAGRTVEAEQAALRLMTVSGDAAGDRTSAREILAEVLAMTGQRDRAIALLEELLTVPSNISVPWLRTGNQWDALRGHSRFDQLLQPK